MRALPLAVLILVGIVAIGVAIGGGAAIAAAAVIAAAFAALAWWGGAWIVGWRLGAQPLAGGAPPALARAVAAIEAESGERIAILRASTLLPNAVALGDGRIVLNDGLLQTLNEAELEAVLRHLQERSDGRSDAAVAVLVMPFLFAAALLKSLLVIASGFSAGSEYGDARRSETAEAESIGSVFAGLIAGPIARLLLLLGANRASFWSSDAAAATLTQHREALVGALEKIERISAPPTSFHRAQYSLITLFWNYLFFANPLEGTPLQRFAALPTARARIARLRRGEGTV